MGTSQKRKKEKQKDFQVDLGLVYRLENGTESAKMSTETKTQGWKSQAKAIELHRYKFPIKRFVAIEFTVSLLGVPMLT